MGVHKVVKADEKESEKGNASETQKWRWKHVVRFSLCTAYISINNTGDTNLFKKDTFNGVEKAMFLFLFKKIKTFFILFVYLIPLVSFTFSYKESVQRGSYRHKKVNQLSRTFLSFSFIPGRQQENVFLLSCFTRQTFCKMYAFANNCLNNVKGGGIVRLLLTKM